MTEESPRMKPARSGRNGRRPRAAAPAPGTPSRTAKQTVELEPENVRRGLGQLVLAVVELVRELLERQAIRRMEAGSLTGEQEERLGLTFMALRKEIERLRDHFGLTEDDLNLDLGPLGRLF